MSLGEGKLTTFALCQAQRVPCLNRSLPSITHSKTSQGRRAAAGCSQHRVQPPVCMGVGGRGRSGAHDPLVQPFSLGHIRWAGCIYIWRGGVGVGMGARKTGDEGPLRFVCASLWWMAGGKGLILCFSGSAGEGRRTACGRG